MFVRYVAALERLLPDLPPVRGGIWYSPHMTSIARSAIEALLVSAQPDSPASEVLQVERVEAVLRILLKESFPSTDHEWHTEEAKEAERAYAARVAETVSKFTESDRLRIRSSIHDVRENIAPLIKFITADLNTARHDDADPQDMEEWQAWADKRYGSFWGCLFSMGLVVVVSACASLLVGLTVQFSDSIRSPEFRELLVFAALFAVVFVVGIGMYHALAEAPRRAAARNAGDVAVVFYRTYRKRRRANDRSAREFLDLSKR